MPAAVLIDLHETTAIFSRSTAKAAGKSADKQFEKGGFIPQSKRNGSFQRPLGERPLSSVSPPGGGEASGG